jgi:hypothetical protein
VDELGNGLVDRQELLLLPPPLVADHLDLPLAQPVRRLLPEPLRLVGDVLFIEGRKLR